MGLISAAFNLDRRLEGGAGRATEARMSGQPSYLGVATAGWVAALKSSDSLERGLAPHALAEIGRAAREATRSSCGGSSIETANHRNARHRSACDLVTGKLKMFASLLLPVIEHGTGAAQAAA
jgi:hypothetical protein